MPKLITPVTATGSGRIWLDSLPANFGITIEKLQKLIDNGYTIVVANTCIDMAIFQQNPDWFEEMLAAKKIVIEIWFTPDEMTSKKDPFFWSSCCVETKGSQSFKDAIAILPNRDEILVIADLMNAYGIPKGQWPQGQWSAPIGLAANIAAELGLEAGTKNRTAVLNAAKAAKRMDLFDLFNYDYNHGLAMQHTCTHIINSDGSLTAI